MCYQDWFGRSTCEFYSMNHKVSQHSHTAHFHLLKSFMKITQTEKLQVYNVLCYHILRLPSSHLPNVTMKPTSHTIHLQPNYSRLKDFHVMHECGLEDMMCTPQAKTSFTVRASIYILYTIPLDTDLTERESGHQMILRGTVHSTLSYYLSMTV